MTPSLSSEQQCSGHEIFFFQLPLPTYPCRRGTLSHDCFDTPAADEEASSPIVSWKAHVNVCCEMTFFINFSEKKILAFAKFRC